MNPSTPTAAAFRPVAVGRSAPEPGESRGDRIVVIGAGVLGISTAMQLARHGAHVTVVTEEQVCSGASGRSLSWLNSAGDRTAEYHALRMAGIDRYRTLAMTVPESADWLRFDGALMWAGADESFADTLRAEHAAGYDAQWVGPHEVTSVTPGVAAEAVAAEGAIFNPGEGWVDLARLVAFLAAEAGRLGVEVIEHAGSARPHLVGDRVVGVQLAGGRVLPAEVVVLAAGAGTPALAADLGTRLDDASPIALLVRARAKDPAARIDLRAVLNTPRVAIRPAPGGTFVLDSAWSEEEVQVHADGTWSYRESTVAGLLAEASNVLAGHPELEMIEVAMGPKPVPGDGDPVFGWLPSADNVYAMFTHSGATLGLIAPELAAREILTGVDCPLLTVFRPTRFAALSAPALAR